MNQNDFNAIAVLHNSFPDGFEDKEMRLRTLEKLLDGVASEAICEAAQRFCSGEVKGQSTRKAPTVPEFVQEAKRIHREVLPYRNRQALPAPSEPVRDPAREKWKEEMRAIGRELIRQGKVPPIIRKIFNRESA